MHPSPTTTRRESFLAISLVILTTLLTYGPLISQLGFYRDDWYLIWTAQTQGRDGILSLLKGIALLLGGYIISIITCWAVRPCIGIFMYCLSK